MILVDAVITYPSGTVSHMPDSSLTWAHLVSTISQSDMTTFATSIGINISRLQVRPDTTEAHYDITAAEQTAAITAGAVLESGKALYAQGYDAPANKHGGF